MRSYSVVGLLCSSRAEALKILREKHRQGTKGKVQWGLVEINDGPPSSRVQRVTFNLLPPVQLRMLERLLNDPAVRKTKAGLEARKLVRAARRRTWK